MIQPSKSLKKLVCMAKGGIAGAFIFTVTALVLFLLLIGYSRGLFDTAHTNGSWAENPTDNEVFWGFIVVAIVGFIFGIIKHRSLIIQRAFPSAIILGIPLVLCVWLLYACANGVRIPRQIEIIDCTNNIVRAHLRFPNGRYHRFTLSTVSSITNEFSCKLGVFNGSVNITNLLLSSEQLEVACDFLKAQTNYDLEITFDQTPPPSTSLRLHWLQTYGEKKADEKALP